MSTIYNGWLAGVCIVYIYKIDQFFSFWIVTPAAKKFF